MSQALSNVFKLHGIINIRDPKFAGGAKGDGITDCAAAIRAAFDLAIASPTGTAAIYVPPGEWLLDSAVQPPSYGNNIRITLFGDGENVSRIVVNSSGGGILLTTSNRRSPFILRDIAIVSKVPNGGTAFQFNNTSPGGAVAYRVFQARNVMIGGHNETSSPDYGFNKYLVATGHYRPLIENVKIWNTAAATYAGEVGIDISDNFRARISATRVNVNLSSAKGVNVGIKDVASVVQGEGGQLHNVTVVGAGIGYQRVRGGREPELIIAESHFNCYEKGVELDGVKYGVFVDNLMYVQTPSAATYKDWDVLNARSLEFKGNGYRQNPTTNRYHIHLNPTGGGAIVDDVDIDDFRLQATATRHVRIESACERISVRLPHEISDESDVAYNGKTGTSVGITDLVDDQTTVGLGRVKITRPGTIINSSSGTLTIASGVVTVIGSYHRIDTESAAASDDLDTINGGVDGMIVTFKTVNSARDVVLKHATGNIKLSGGVARTLSHRNSRITLAYDGSDDNWCEVAYSDSAV
jgi:hypothetical protein